MSVTKREKMDCIRANSERYLEFIWDSEQKEFPTVECWVKYEKLKFWDRLKLGIRYILGKDTTLDYIVLGKEHSYQLQKVTTHLKGKRKKYESNKG